MAHDDLLNITGPDDDSNGQAPSTTKRRGRPKTPVKRATSTPGLRAYTNDLVHQAIEYLPHAARFGSLLEFREYLYRSLPLNSQNTRERYSQYLLNRFFPGDRYESDLIEFAQRFAGTSALKDVVFYLTASAEPIVGRIASEVVFPAVARGGISRTEVASAVEARLHVARSAIGSTAQAIVRTYARLEVAKIDTKTLHLRLRECDLDALAFVLHREYPEPGMHDLEPALDGPMHQWLLWSRESIRRGLYLLRERGILNRVSEIDTVRQFTTRYSPAEAAAEWCDTPGGD